LLIMRLNSFIGGIARGACVGRGGIFARLHGKRVDEGILAEQSRTGGNTKEQDTG